MPARAKKTPGRTTRKSTRQGNDSALGLPSTPGWQPASSDMFTSPSFTPPQSPPRSRPVKAGRVTKAKAEPKSRRLTLASAAKVMSPRLTRGRRATMLPSDLVTIKSPPTKRGRASVYQRPGAKKGTVDEDFKMPDPVAIMRASRKKSPVKKVSPKKTTTKTVKAAPAAKQPAPKKSPTITKKSPKPTRTSPSKPALPIKKSPAPKATAKVKTPKVTPKIVTRTRTPALEVSIQDIFAVTPSNASVGSVKKGLSTGRGSRSAKQVKQATPVSSKVKTTTPTAKSSTKKVISTKSKNTSIRTSRRSIKASDSAMDTSSFYSSPKVGYSPIPVKALPRSIVATVKTPVVLTPVNKQLERLRIMDTDPAKKVRITSEKSDSLTKVYRKTPSRGQPQSINNNATPAEVKESSTGTPITAGKTSSKKVKPMKLAASILSPKTSTPRELRKRRAAFPEPVSEIRVSKKISLETTATKENIPADITADLSIAKPQDVRPASWWGWCNIL